MLGKGSSVWPDSPPRAWGGSYAQRPPLPSSIGASIGSPGGADSGGETKAVCPCGARIEIARPRPSGWGQRSRGGLLPAPTSPSEGGFPAWSVPVLPRPAPPGSPCPVRWCGGGGGWGARSAFPAGGAVAGSVDRQAAVVRAGCGLARCGGGLVPPSPLFSFSRSGAAASAAPARRGLCPPRFGAGSPPQSSMAGSAAPRPAALPLRGARPACGAGLVRRVAHQA